MRDHIDWSPLFAQRMEKADLTLRNAEGGEKTVPVELYALRLGDIAMVTNPLELYLDFGTRIQERSEAVQTFIVQLAGSGSYLAPERAVERGAYGTGGHVGPQGGRDLVDWSVNTIADLFDPRLMAVENIRLPREGWRFSTDPGNQGHDGGWNRPGYDDTHWRQDIPIEISWQKHLEDDYYGAAWYRSSFEVPGVAVWDRAVLDFQGVDEQAFVWLNGTFVGSHEMGSHGWNVPFRLDATKAVRPGEINQITVRVLNTAGAGGIWKPVYLRLLHTGAFHPR